MSKLFVILAILFCHVIADYNLQGWLASAKQREWWEKNASDKMYRYDYLCVLLMHSISWSFCIMLPVAIYRQFDIGIIFLIIFIFNVLFHAMVDNAKANWKIISLWEDQIWHMIQIVFTALIFLK